jgi:hypothetical protein
MNSNTTESSDPMGIFQSHDSNQVELTPIVDPEITEETQTTSTLESNHNNVPTTPSRAIIKIEKLKRKRSSTRSPPKHSPPVSPVRSPRRRLIQYESDDEPAPESEDNIADEVYDPEDLDDTAPIVDDHAFVPIVHPAIPIPAPAPTPAPVTPQTINAPDFARPPSASQPAPRQDPQRNAIDILIDAIAVNEFSAAQVQAKDGIMKRIQEALLARSTNPGLLHFCEWTSSRTLGEHGVPAKECIRGKWYCTAHKRRVMEKINEERYNATAPAHQNATY